MWMMTTAKIFEERERTVKDTRQDCSGNLIEFSSKVREFLQRRGENDSFQNLNPSLGENACTI